MEDFTFYCPVLSKKTKKIAIYLSKNIEPCPTPTEKVKEVLVYLCKNQLASELSITKIPTYIQNTATGETTEGKGIVTASVPLIPLNETLLDCVSKNFEGEFTWTREYNIVNKRPEPFITFEWDDPDFECSDCLWNKIIVAKPLLGMPSSTDIIVIVNRDIISDGEIPLSGDIDDYFAGSIPGIKKHNETQIKILPGEEIGLFWSIRNGHNTYIPILIRQHYFHTPLFTGGEIISEAVISQDKPFYKEYTVRSEGKDLVLVGTDFAQYQVGSWVFCIKTNAESELINRESDYGNKNDDEASFLFPARFGGSAGSGQYQTKPMDLRDRFADVFEYSYHKGTVIKKYSGENFLDVDVDLEGVLTSLIRVPIFYHCQNTTTVEKGWEAFQEADEVLVLNESPRQGSLDPSNFSVIGFQGEKKLCLVPLLIMRVGTKCTVVNLENFQKIDFAVKNDGSQAVFPCEYSEISNWIALYSRLQSVSVSKMGAYPGGMPTVSYPPGCATSEEEEIPGGMKAWSDINCVTNQSAYDIDGVYRTKQATRIGRIDSSSFETNDPNVCNKLDSSQNVTQFIPFYKQHIRFLSSTNLGGQRSLKLERTETVQTTEVHEY